MLNIPEAVKDLYKEDNVKKNFRVVFPDGQFPDITNKDIVAESVKFTESMCSTDVLRYGVAEDSVIEFETVGIGNMYGMRIQCFNEIDVSTLTAEEIAEIEAGTWDGELVTDTDIDFPFFRVPYGTFRVDKCPRSSGEMTHRKVTAYGIFATKTYLTDEGEIFFNRFTEDDAFIHWDMEVSTYRHFGIPLTGTEAPDDYPGLHSEAVTPITWNGKNLYVIWDRVLNDDGASIGYSYTRRIEWARAMTSQEVYDTIYAGISTAPNWTEEEAAEVSRYLVTAYFQYPKSTNAYVDPATGPDPRTYNRGNPYYITTPLFFPTGVYLGSYTAPTKQIEFATFSYTPYEYRYTDTITFEIPVKVTLFRDADGTYKYQKDIDPVDILKGVMELSGRLWKQKRTGGALARILSKDNPVTIPASLYSEFWWDEYDANPVGTVRYKYHDEEDVEVLYQFGTGLSVYDMTDNFIIQKMHAPTGEKINALLDAYFIPNIGDIGFTPVDLDMRGLPYVEPGDYLLIDPADGASMIETRDPVIGPNNYRFLPQVISDGQLSTSRVVAVAYKGFTRGLEITAAGTRLTGETYFRVPIDFEVGKEYSLTLYARRTGGRVARVQTYFATSDHVYYDVEDEWVTIKETRVADGTNNTLVFGCRVGSNVQFCGMRLASEDSLIGTYIMRRAMDGVYSLFDAIESSGGEITGEVEE